MKKVARGAKPGKAETDHESAQRPLTAYSDSAEYPLEPTFTMRLVGDWTTGGVLEFIVDGELEDHIKLTPVRWATVAQLFMVAINAPLSHWLHAALTAKDLAERLYKRGVVAWPMDSKIHRYVSDIRTLLAKTKIRKLTGVDLFDHQWAASVLKTLGNRSRYRIGLPPQNLQLWIGKSEFVAGNEICEN